MKRIFEYIQVFIVFIIYSFVSASTKPDDEIPAVDSSALEALKTSAEESFVLQANSTATSSSTQVVILIEHNNFFFFFELFLK